jgi:predicted esterase YcpF (UPF0227 family)
VKTKKGYLAFEKTATQKSSRGTTITCRPGFKALGPYFTFTISDRNTIPSVIFNPNTSFLL